MSYTAWKNAYQKRANSDSTGVCFAKYYNLKSETRIAGVLSQFKRVLGKQYETELKNGFSSDRAAELALDKALNSIKPTWLLKLPIPSKLPDIVTGLVTHITSEYAARRGDIMNENHPIPKFKCKSPLKIKNGKPEALFIWVTFEPNGHTFKNNPNEVAHELGLAHFEGNVYMYRILLVTIPNKTYIPSCLDARLYEAWALPPDGHKQPWGLTRFLSNGLPAKPELLTKTTNHAHEYPQAILVSSTVAQPQFVGQLNIDYWANRE